MEVPEWMKKLGKGIYGRAAPRPVRPLTHRMVIVLPENVAPEIAPPQLLEEDEAALSPFLRDPSEIYRRIIEIANLSEEMKEKHGIVEGQFVKREL